MCCGTAVRENTGPVVGRVGFYSCWKPHLLDQTGKLSLQFPHHVLLALPAGLWTLILRIICLAGQKHTGAWSPKVGRPIRVRAPPHASLLYWRRQIIHEQAGWQYIILVRVITWRSGSQVGHAALEPMSVALLLNCFSKSLAQHRSHMSGVNWICTPGLGCQGGWRSDRSADSWTHHWILLKGWFLAGVWCPTLLGAVTHL